MTHYLVGTEIRAALIARPFRRFVIHMFDGTKFDVKDPEMVMAPSDSQTVVLYRGNHQYSFIDVPKIESIEFEKSGGRRGGWRRKAG